MLDKIGSLSFSKKFYFCLLFFVSGIFSFSLLPSDFLPDNIGLFFWQILFFLIFLAIVSMRSVPISTILLFIIFFQLGAWRFSSYDSTDRNDLSIFVGKKISVFGKVAGDPELKSRSQKFVFAVEKTDDSENNAVGKILVLSSRYPKFRYGDYLRIDCILEKPGMLDDFDYAAYLERYGVGYFCPFPKNIEMTRGDFKKEKPIILRIKELGMREIFIFKDQMRALINRGLSEPEAGLARGIVLGDKWAIDENFTKIFSRVGISHMIAISGMNFAILIVIFGWLLFLIGWNRQRSFFIILTLLIVYVIMVGLPASAVRAVWMGSIGLYAYKIGRVPYLNRLLLLAGSIMLAFNPLLIKVDLGFILSFVAVLAIANTYFLYKDLLQRIPWRWLKALAAILCVSLVAQIVTWPIISRNFSVISIVAPLANIFVVWLLSGVMIAVLLGIFLSFIFPGLAIWFFLPAKISLTYIFSVSEFFAAGKFASIDYQMENDLFFFVYYFVLILAVCYLKRRKRSF